MSRACLAFSRAGGEGSSLPERIPYFARTIPRLRGCFLKLGEREADVAWRKVHAALDGLSDEAWTLFVSCMSGVSYKYVDRLPEPMAAGSSVKW